MIHPTCKYPITTLKRFALVVFNYGVFTLEKHLTPVETFSYLSA